MRPGHGGWRGLVHVALWTGAGVLVALVVRDALGGWAAAGAGLALYNRLNRSATFDNETRRRIFDQVRALPGVCIADIASSVGVSHSTASYHLDKLVEFSLVTSTIDGNKVRFFVNGGAFTEEERRMLAVLDNAETRRVLDAIVKNPWCYRAELTALLGVSSPTVNWHLDRLEAAGLVIENKTGRNRFLYADKRRLNDWLATLLKKLRETTYDATGLEALLEASRAPPV
ncbi:MAG TPA: helix-turn-helix domain-containing protein [Candidatus Thermoplasmatota archaeon]|nr:helix-turn-helix domain-containing protein [Candidatus Thermoplasmatota archaeon]